MLILIKFFLDIVVSFVWKIYSIKFVQSLTCNLKYKIDHTTKFHGSASVKDFDMQYQNESISMDLSPTCLIFVCVYYVPISKQIILFLNEQQNDSG